MGGTPSKHEETQDGWKASLLRTSSVPTSINRTGDENSTKVSWKSRLFSKSQSYSRGKSVKYDGMVSKLKPVKEEEVELHFDDYPEDFECLNGLDRKRQDGTAGAFLVENGRLLNRSITFQPASEAESQRRLFSPCKSFREEGSKGYGPHSNTLSSRDLMDQSIGLRLLLSPSSSSQSLVSPSRGASLQKSLSMKESLNSGRGNDFARRAFTRVCMDDASPLEPQWVTASSTLTDPDVPLFDPSILATFEKAVEDMAHNTYQSSPVSTLENTFMPTETCKDADKSKLLKESGHSLSRLKSLRSRAAKEDRLTDDLPQLGTFAFLKRKPSFSKVFSLKNDKRNWSSQDYLDKFVRMCPPGCEGKVVLYFTSLRGVRKTFENCFMVRLILKGFRVHVDERDVWMHSKFRQELTDVMGMALSVPRLFILGRYIGGADEVELLNEEGILAKLLEGLPTECRQVCNVCADVRFIPCTACRGSRKIITSSDGTERCSKCNENGLIMCPMCDW
eukprot:c20195_g1_i1 orf=626-2143(+)